MQGVHITAGQLDHTNLTDPTPIPMKSVSSATDYLVVTMATAAGFRKPLGGLVTWGSAKPPIDLYAGPTTRQQIKKATALLAVAGESHSPSLVPNDPGQEGESLGNVNRGDKIRTCDLVDPNHAL